MLKGLEVGRAKPHISTNEVHALQRLVRDLKTDRIAACRHPEHRKVVLVKAVAG